MSHIPIVQNQNQLNNLGSNFHPFSKNEIKVSPIPTYISQATFKPPYIKHFNIKTTDSNNNNNFLYHNDKMAPI